MMNQYLKKKVAAVQKGYEQILTGLGLDWKESDHLMDTPHRAAKAMVMELCAGLHSPAPKITTFPAASGSGMLVSLGIPVRSLCAHHLLPFVGTAAVGYIPGCRIIGLSKLTRIVEHESRRPNVQEELTAAVATHLLQALTNGIDDSHDHPDGIGVVIRSRHFCMEVRGVNHISDVVTSAVRGSFLDDMAVRAEFLSLVNSHTK